MSLFAKATSSSKRVAIHTIRRNFLTTRLAMSTISDAIKRDHKEINECADNIRAAKDDDSKARWQNQFTWELARHSIGEELVVYPAFAKHLGAKGQDMADKDREQHQSVWFGRLQWSCSAVNDHRSRKLCSNFKACSQQATTLYQPSTLS
jgi:hypothetical protein